MSQRVLSLLLDARQATRQGPAALAGRQRARLAEMVAFARANSPYYRRHYHDLPDHVADPAQLPVTSKQQLMAGFNDWVTDRHVTIDRVRAFVDDPGLIGERLLGRYTVATTSGTTGTPGIFLIDDRSFAVAGAMAFRMLSNWLGVRDVLRIMAGRGRMAMVNAMGGHFASAIAATRLQRKRGKRLAVFPVRMPLAEMVAGLNAFRPALLAPYASMGLLLAGEQKAGRLKIHPVLIVLSAEGLAAEDYSRIARAFGSKVRDSYAATECPFLSYRCERGWLHVNSDWVVLEPVDAEHRPVPPGVQSHTVLVSNLANRVQPILRYDLGDSVLQRPDACPCGNPLPAIRVRGRAADALTFRNDRGERITLASLLFATVVDAVPGIDQLQIVQTSDTSVRVRLRPAPGAEVDHVWRSVQAEFAHLFTEHGLDRVTVERSPELPQQSPGGKFRQVIPLS